MILLPSASPVASTGARNDAGMHIDTRGILWFYTPACLVHYLVACGARALNAVHMLRFASDVSPARLPSTPLLTHLPFLASWFCLLLSGLRRGTCGTRVSCAVAARGNAWAHRCPLPAAASPYPAPGCRHSLMPVALRPMPCMLFPDPQTTTTVVWFGDRLPQPQT